MKKFFLLSILLPLMLSGCDYLGLESQEAIQLRKDKQAQAIGAGCRHSARAIEDCYTLHPKISKSAIFLGWKEMDQYMKENNIKSVVPQISIETPEEK